MTWIKFAIWLFGIYTAYYTALLIWDSLRNKGLPVGDHPEELTFVEDVEPVLQVPDEPNGNQTGSAVVSSGGVTLKQTFNLAREEAIDYIRAVSFY